MFDFKTLGRHFDFMSVVAGAGLTPQQITIIESNLATQINVKIGYTVIGWNAERKPNVVKKYEDSTMNNLLFTTTLNWVGKTLDNVVIVNEDDNITETTTLTFTNGLLTEVEKA